MLDVGGQDATEAFEDVGHSDEARETLDQLLVGSLKRQVRQPVPLHHMRSALRAPLRLWGWEIANIFSSTLTAR